MSSTMNKNISMKSLLRQSKEIIEGNGSPDDILQQICQLLSDKVDIFDWVGFYLVEPDADRELKLGPYVGEPTDHVRIPFGRGICGQAADTLETYVVQDVNEAENYLSCSVDVKSEIVVPVMKGDQLIGELDIDSHTKNAISDEHKVLCEKICVMVSELY